MLEQEKQKTIVDVSKTLIEWAKEYYGENKEVMRLFGINSADELSARILELNKQYINEKSK